MVLTLESIVLTCKWWPVLYGSLEADDSLVELVLSLEEYTPKTKENCNKYECKTSK